MARSISQYLLPSCLAMAIAWPAAICAAQSSAHDDASPQNANLQAIVNESIKQYHIKGIVVQVRDGGKTYFLEAAGESMTGVPVTPAMHFRNGAMAFTYISTMLLELVDQQPEKVRLDDKLSRFLPEIPGAACVTLRELLNMTSGYRDYVYTDTLLDGLNADPFRQWTPEEMIHLGAYPPVWFDPGKNWAYSHTNYVILGRVLEKITGMPLAEGMEKYIFRPMGLRQTRSIDTPQIPDPVLHTFSSERRESLRIPASLPFYEEATFWNPSWTTAEGAVQITDIADMSRSMEIVGEGLLLSPASSEAQLSPLPDGFGHKQKGCDPCQSLSFARNYGLGIVLRGPWLTQTKSFAGSSATVGYLPSAKVTVAIVCTYTPEAYDDQGNSSDASVPIFSRLADAVAPHTLPPN